MAKINRHQYIRIGNIQTLDGKTRIKIRYQGSASTEAIKGKEEIFQWHLTILGESSLFDLEDDILILEFPDGKQVEVKIMAEYNHGDKHIRVWLKEFPDLSIG